MDLDGQLTQEQFHSTPVGCISNDFDVNEFELEEEEQEGEKDMIGDVVSSDSDDSDDDQGGRHAMPTPVDAMQYLFMVCHYQYQLRFCILSRLRVD